ncbi:hypothetical protein AX15_006244 [Amanita polypyramis BW_CC]|nr:hypothetical protein AX15_006244 [Amanita polypyramis BW_CC]
MVPDHAKLRTLPRHCAPIQQSCSTKNLKIVDGLDRGVPFKCYYKFPQSAEFFQPPGPLVKTPLKPRPLRLNLGDLECTKTLGQGEFGRVLLVKTRRKAHEYDFPEIYFALKAYSKKRIRAAETGDRAEKDVERKYLSKLPWNAFVNGVVDVFHDARNIYMMLEYIPCGTLRPIIREQGPLDLTRAMFYFVNIACGLDFLEEHNIVHRDLKPENILLGADGYLVLSDFGIAEAPSAEQSLSEWTMMGTPQYMAPECISPALVAPISYGSTVDWWSSGCIFYELLIGRPAFSSPNYTVNGTLEVILKQKITWPEDIPVGKDVKSVVESLLHVNTYKRLGYHGYNEVSSHPVFRKIDWSKVENKLYIAPHIPPSPHDAGEWHKYPLPRQTEIPGLKIAELPAQLAHDARFRTGYCDY